MPETREGVHADGAGGGDVAAVDGFAAGGDDARERAGEGGREAQGFGEDGVEVGEAGCGGEGDVAGGAEGAAEVADEAGVDGGVG